MANIEMEKISEIYDAIIDNNYNHDFIANINGHPFDIVAKYFILEHINFIKYDEDIFDNNEHFFNLYKIYFSNSYIYIGDFNYTISLTNLIKDYRKRTILEFHNNLIDNLKNDDYKHSTLTKEQFIYLTDLYDTQFKMRLMEEISNINFKLFWLIKDCLEEEQLNEIRREYRYLSF